MRRLAVVGLGLGLALSACGGGGNSALTRARPPSPTVAPTMSLPPATPPAMVPGTRQPPQDQLLAAAQVATAFLAAYTTGPGCETDQQLVARLRPYLTRRLATELSQSAAPPCTVLGPSVGHVAQLTSEGLTPDGYLGFIAQVQVTLIDSGQEESVDFELFLVRESEDWRVDEVRQ